MGAHIFNGKENVYVFMLLPGCLVFYIFLFFFLTSDAFLFNFSLYYFCIELMQKIDKNEKEVICFTCDHHIRIQKRVKRKK